MNFILPKVVVNISTKKTKFIRKQNFQIYLRSIPCHFILLVFYLLTIFFFFIFTYTYLIYQEFNSTTNKSRNTKSIKLKWTIELSVAVVYLYFINAYFTFNLCYSTEWRSQITILFIFERINKREII